MPLYATFRFELSLNSGIAFLRWNKDIEPFNQPISK